MARCLKAYIHILEIIVLQFSMQGGDIIEDANGKCHVCIFLSMQEEDILEHTNVKCHLYTLSSTCRPLSTIDIK